MSKRSDITGVVLAGGKSSRMGHDKALLKLGGETMIERVVRALEEVFESVVIVSDGRESYSFLGVPVAIDILRNCGPLGGIHAGLTIAKTDAIFVASCDLGFLTSAAVFSIVNRSPRFDAVVATTESGVQPLCGIYSRRCLPALEEHLRCGRLSVQRFLQTVSTSTVHVQVDSLVNVNTPDEYATALAFRRAPG